MQTLYYIFVALFIAVIINDWLLARMIRKAAELGRLKFQDSEGLGFGGPLGIIYNLFRFRKIPEANNLSDPDHIAILRQYRAQQVLVGSLVVCIAAVVIRSIAA